MAPRSKTQRDPVDRRVAPSCPSVNSNSDTLDLISYFFFLLLFFFERKEETVASRFRYRIVPFIFFVLLFDCGGCGTGGEWV